MKMEVSELDKKMIEVIDILRAEKPEDRLNRTIEFTISIMANIVNEVSQEGSARVKLRLWEAFASMMSSFADVGMTQKELRK